MSRISNISVPECVASNQAQALTECSATEIGKFSVLDIFCGAGGFSEGFRQAGFKIVAGIDNDFEALMTYANNFPEGRAFHVDLSATNIDIGTQPIQEIVADGIDVIIGGTPCQGFSIAGKRLADDPRNTLYRAFINLVDKISPTAVVLENVPTILSLHNGRVAKAIVEDLALMGYQAKVFTLNSADYGVPQNRRRTFFVGIRGDSAFKIPAPINAFNPVTTEMAISDLPLLDDQLGGEVLPYEEKPTNEYQLEMRMGSEAIYNHFAVEHKKRTVDIIKLVPDGGNYMDLPEHLRNTRKVHIAWTRMNSKKPSFTIDAGHNHHFHYQANRVPTVRECSRIQSFPDRFRFFGKKTSQFRQVGNAVPPLLAKAIAIELREALK